ncbi:MAG: ABC transporter permease [Armatimonadetes bacterium]|nr:ABC transporter permease [Armatimonadota bacterium]
MKQFALTVLFLVGVLVLSFLVFGVPLGEGAKLLAEGAFGDKVAVSQSVVRATPVLLTAIGITVAWRAGAFNIGGEGQLLIGALFAATVGKAILNSGLGFAGCLLMLLAAAIGGAVWSGLAAVLYLKRGVDLVISTILLNFIGDKLLLYFIEGPIRKAGQTAPLTDQIPDAMMLPKFSRQSDLHLGIFFALVVALAVGYWMFRTKSGYFARIVGANPRFARVNRIDADRVKFRAMILSGAICGLAGGIQFLGINGQLASSFSQQYGFLGIPVALVGALNPFAVIPSALFFGGLFAATSNLSRFGGIGNYFVYVIQAGTVIGLLLFRAVSERRIAAKGEAA